MKDNNAGEVILTQFSNEEYKKTVSEIQEFSFKDFKVGEEYNVVINGDGNSIPIIAPNLEYYATPKGGFLKHHVYFGCHFPAFTGSTIIPASGMYEYYFFKRYIQHEHSRLNGKINAWRIETLRVLDKVTHLEDKKLKVKRYAVLDQDFYAKERVDVIQQHIHKFENCCISLLNKDAISKCVLQGLSQCSDDTNLVYYMSKYTGFQLIVKTTGESRNEFDLVTRFDNNEKLDFVFGKSCCDRLGKIIDPEHQLFHGEIYKDK